ncbi:TPA: tyrosine recombinase XerC [Stenotrophomonas maltophilia]|uniref:site-specific integrase n=1 Tax=Stenotrophomonas maltophilia TaxID=40324 RepID=UPI0013101C7A|nr:integrase [Stenotrophomonas maltophilia]MBH1493772.1 integrase [Stenotrophomonas maltophilia]MBN4961248.1 integrase [Stenotrophomonas maltophilia]MCO7494958.1 integrase [Stenotrophomonas maltophilia]NRP01841.1 integrase [Stenotrophomonas maltophilia]
MARGRKRKFNPEIPGHIEQDALPQGIYWHDNRWYVLEDHAEGGRRVKRTVAHATARLSELHAIVESLTTGQQRGTVRYLFDRFHESSEFRELSLDTQDDYKRYADSLANYVRKCGTPFGRMQVDRITTPVVQRLVEVFARGRPATKTQPALPAFPSKANHQFRYLRRTLAWGVRHGYCKSNPAQGVRQAKEAREHKMPTPDAFAKVLTFARERGARRPHTKGSCPAYIAPAMVLAFSARLRGIEVCTLTDAHRLDQGVHGERRKGSRASVTEWNEEMIEAWEALVTRRNAIWNRKGRNFPVPIRPEQRFLLVEQTGNPIARSSMSSAWQRFIRMAMSEGVIEEDERFSMHGLKHRGITDTEGNRGDKQDAAGHKSPTTTGRYDHDMPVVKPPRKR